MKRKTWDYFGDEGELWGTVVHWRACRRNGNRGGPRLPLGRSTGSLWATVRLGLAGGLGPGLGRNGGEGWWGGLGKRIGWINAGRKHRGWHQQKINGGHGVRRKKEMVHQIEHGKGTAGNVPHRNGWTTTEGRSFRMAVAMRGWGWRGAKGKDTVACGASPTVPGRGCGPRVGPRGHMYERHHVVWAIQTEGGGVGGVGTSASGS
jgi:hypothetical protein